jgi:hypothetical protein
VLGINLTSSRSQKLPLTTLPVPSTSLTEDVVFENPLGEALLRFEFKRDGVHHRGGLRFDRVRAYRFRAEGHCKVWHIDEAYDTLVEVSDSEWVEDLSAAEPAEMWGKWRMRHFMIYIDSAGCYEIVAHSWEWLPEERL